MYSRLIACLLALFVAAFVELPSYVTAQPDAFPYVETLAQRTYFYVGGRYMNATLDGAEEAQYMVGQMYVELLTPPVKRFRHPLVFIHGLAQTGTNWLNTPDNREGWASYFLRQGYVVYLTDQAQRGRSPWLPGDGIATTISSNLLTSVFTAPEKVDPLPYPQASLHTQWPGSGLPGDPIFDAFYASQIQYQNNATLTALYNNQSYVALLDLIGKPVILVTHSQAGLFGWQVGDARPELIAGIIAVEPGAGPFDSYNGPPYTPGYLPLFPPNRYGITDLPLKYEPRLPPDQSGALLRQEVSPASADRAPCVLQAEPARRLSNLATIPVLQIVGEASFQSVYSECISLYLKQAGVEVDFVRLEDVGIHGNGHFCFLEKNNIEVAERVITPWLRGRESLNA